MATPPSRPARSSPPSTTKAFFTPGCFLHLVQVGVGDLAAEHRTFDVGRVQHPRHGDVDTEQRLAPDDLGAVDPAHGLADDDVVLGVLQRDLVRIGCRQQRRLRRQFAIAQLAAAGGVDHDTGLGRALGGGYAPSLRCGGHQHRPRGWPRPAAADPNSSASPDCLRRTASRTSPYRAARSRSARWPSRQSSSSADQHRQHGLHALADLRDSSTGW